MAGRWFSLGTLVYSTNRTDRHDIAEILLKVALNTTNQTKPEWNWLHGKGSNSYNMILESSQECASGLLF